MCSWCICNIDTKRLTLLDIDANHGCLHADDSRGTIPTGSTIPMDQKWFKGKLSDRWKHSNADQFRVCNTCLFGWWVSVCIILYYHLWRTTINVTDSTKVYDNKHPKHFLFSIVGNDSWCCFRPVFENMGIPWIQRSRCATVNWSKAKKHCWLGNALKIQCVCFSFMGKLPSGKHTKNFWKWPFIVDFPMKHGDFP